MRMKNPCHPGELIKSDIEAMGISVAEAASALGITRQQLYRVINKQSSISSDMALRLERSVGSTAEFWLNAQVHYDLAQARRKKQRPAAKKIVWEAA